MSAVRTRRAVSGKMNAYRNISTGVRVISSGVFIPIKLKTLQPRGNTFIFDFCSVQKAAIYCSSIYANPNGTIVSVQTNVTNTVNMWFRLNLRSNKSAQIFKM